MRALGVAGLLSSFGSAVEIRYPLCVKATIRTRRDEIDKPPWRQPRGKWMVSLVNSHTNAISKRKHRWKIDLRFALDSTPGWVRTLRRCEPQVVPG